MKLALVALLGAAPILAHAQVVAPGATPPPRMNSQQAASAFAVRPPDEGSPFFADREAAKFLLSADGRRAAKANEVALYPKVKDSPDSAAAMFAKFFTDMFSSVNLRAFKGRTTTEHLAVEPAQFSLGERREVEAAYTLRNDSNKILRLDYETSQRIDIVTRDPAGKVIERWSDDRAFKPQEGIVIINPRERIEYREKIPTREMKAGETYTIQSEITGHPEYNAARTVTPTP